MGKSEERVPLAHLLVSHDGYIGEPHLRSAPIHQVTHESRQPAPSPHTAQTEPAREQPTSPSARKEGGQNTEPEKSAVSTPSDLHGHQAREV
jgi:hypothetical protein